MKKTLIILGFITAVFAVILVVTPLFKIALFPAIIAVLSGLGVLYLANKTKTSKKVVQYIFLLSIMSLAIMTYKSITDTSEVGNTEALEELEKSSEEDALEELEGIDLDIE
ncbi:FUSC family protein [Ichthyenterobacterium sp. W332]|uniref:FUSC family protein n=1 Tax=Microcosmobacter mediterraneus TaxID=3075607 RepID=A0ABU2YHI7_9FLAO|nr:FUSC family protein [Ichthyenterobacterium sp. W332]MDT0557633.1 FUSC family protein [Ichthyenterobacterium sp. W332]